jgi:hypothetical protein
MPAPTQPLGKIYTLKKVRSIISRWLKKETQEDLDPVLIDDFIMLAVLGVSEILSGAGSDDYGKTQIISDASSSYVALGLTGGSYDYLTRTITKNGHGLTSADIGKRIVFWDATGSPITKIAIAEIKSITSLNAFIVSDSNTTVNISAGNCSYAIYSAFSNTNIDISNYKIANITKIVDSISKEVIKVGDKVFDNLGRFDEKQNKCYWYKHGQYIFLYKGTDVASFGTLTLFYNSYPQIFDQTYEDEFIDMRDNFADLYIAKAKVYCLEHLQITAPESLTNLITQLSSNAREQILRERGMVEMKNTTSKGT